MLNEDLSAIDTLINLALAEDLGAGDATSNTLLPKKLTAKASIVARESLVVCGLPVAKRITDKHGKGVLFNPCSEEGMKAPAGTVIATLEGNARTLLALERTILNFMQRMSGVATLTWQYVDLVAGTRAKILDTRKTIPGWRLLDKYAVRMGGGENHRMGLYDMILIKDNHVALCGGTKAAVEKARDAKLPIVVECDTLDQVTEAMTLPITRILLDNMSLEQLSEAVNRVAGRVALEASGGVNLKTVHAIAETGVNFISIGAITHSAPAVDIALDIAF